jgi:hypothetical protein
MPDAIAPAKARGPPTNRPPRLRSEQPLSCELVGNLHAHTRYSDGAGDHDDLARAAIEAGLDFIVATDHNVYVGGLDGYRYIDNRRTLLLIGEEIHDVRRRPQKNHLLVYEAKRELSPMASNPQRLLDAVRASGGLSFAAHPIDPAAPLFHEDDLSWIDWDLQGLTGIEIWNFMSEYKSLLSSWPRAMYYAYNPGTITRGPFAETLTLWDQLHRAGNRLVGVGGADAHAARYTLGPLSRVLFPYRFLFEAINTHVLIEQPPSGDLEQDRRQLFRAIERGRCFTALDSLFPSRGFGFTAQSDSGHVEMGGALAIGFGVTLQIHVPAPAQIHLLRDGIVMQQWDHAVAGIQVVSRPGTYRVEVYLPGRSGQRGWIFSNPVYLT